MLPTREELRKGVFACLPDGQEKVCCLPACTQDKRKRGKLSACLSDGQERDRCVFCLPVYKPKEESNIFCLPV